jgi:NTE family protein
VDFDLINSGKIRLSVGAVNVKTGNFIYFDNHHQRIGPEHIMASGALPPGFPPVEIDGEFYWDGGLVSNTPLQYVLDEEKDEDLIVLQVDLFPARGPMPQNLFDVAVREKDIRYSSRTRLNTDDSLKMHAAKVALRRLIDVLPKGLVDEEDIRLLHGISQESSVTVVHLIYRNKPYERGSKDYEFSRATMLEHWNSGMEDMQNTLRHREWLSRNHPESGVAVFDLSRKEAPKL